MEQQSTKTIKTLKADIQKLEEEIDRKNDKIIKQKSDIAAGLKLQLKVGY